MDLKQLQSRFTFNVKRFTKTREAYEPQCWVWTWPGSFPSLSYLLLGAFFPAEPFGSNHVLSGPNVGLPVCPLCSFVISLLTNKPLPSPSPAQILAVAVLLQPDPSPFGPGCPWTSAISLTAQCWKVGLCPAGDLQMISSKRP